MGRPKQLLPVNGTPAIKRCLASVLAAGLSDIVVVTGAHGDQVESVIADLPVRVVRNERPESEMVESVRIGLRQAPSGSSSFLLCLADHPLVKPDTLRTLLRHHEAAPGSIIIPRYGGRRGHPCLFPRLLIEEVFSGMTLREVIQRHADRIRLVNVDDEGVVLDMDTPEDYEAVRNRGGIP
jgi:CTP:molybdopterin cytidylyltransferase MocA